MKNRDLYLNKLIQFRDKPLIKVITGIRRCGKSTLLHLFEKHLLETGISADYIIRMNFESFEFNDVTNYKELHTLIQNRLTNKDECHYLLLDEIQQIPSWEKVVNSFLVDANVDIYLTGSNAYLLSSELSTLLSGRYVEIKMQPLSFKEYLDFTGDNKEALPQLFANYLRYGGLPTITDLLDRPDTIGPFLEGVYNTVLIKDVIERNKIRDPALLENILKYIAANIGNVVSTKKISDYLTSSGRKVTTETIDNYLKMLENAFIIYKANRYDLKGKLFLKTLEKYYLVDMGLRNQLTGLYNTDYGHVLENIVYLELLRRGYAVTIGKIGTLEVDFVATKSDEKNYYQVSATILDETTRQRELRPLEAISDNYPKFILTMDNPVFNDYSGIKIVNILDFLLT
ncbi:ATP-binding protein [Acetobacterium sp. K1/6]|jgi:Predicted ATPase (AAA+ superfamily)|uniref:ATP-binding protein n=1 Tax=Acetobacterium sp. K1/6 TaxID=3055467 RepID=UPI002ACA927A|nr:ATP-binding protein [Acetobacterium sp. K1/6]MDZ5724416.1 ATP-binding protein [Acetobacterium sp. K1/6]